MRKRVRELDQTIREVEQDRIRRAKAMIEQQKEIRETQVQKSRNKQIYIVTTKFRPVEEITCMNILNTASRNDSKSTHKWIKHYFKSIEGREDDLATFYQQI